MDTMKEEILEALRKLEALLDRFPQTLNVVLKRYIAELRELLLEHRPPRFALIGRRGAGKSTLVNAIFDEPIAGIGHVGRGTLEPRWYTYESDRGAMEILDTRGIGEALHAGEPNGRKAALDAVVNECKQKGPDAVLFLLKAKEIESRSDEDVADLATICSAIAKNQGVLPAIIAIANQCDELSPPMVRLDWPDSSERYQQKLRAVREVERKLSEKIQAHSSLREQLVHTLGIVSYKEWATNGEVVDDLRWQIDDLLSYMFEELPAEAQLELAHISRLKKLQRELAGRIVQATAAACAAIAATPIPIADIAPITALQVGMIMAIGYISGRDLSVTSAKEFLVAIGLNVGGGVIFKEIARGLGKLLFPGAGSAVSAVIAYAATRGIGAAAIAYFIDAKSAAEAKSEYEQGKRQVEYEYRDRPDDLGFLLQ